MQDEPETGIGFSHKMSLKGKTGCWGLIISMDDSEATSLEQIRAFLAGSGECDLPASGARRCTLGRSGHWCGISMRA